MMIQWRVYYGDGSTFDNTQGRPEEAPCVNVQHIVVRDPDPGGPNGVGRYIVSGKDYYWYEQDEWWGGDLFGFYDYLSRPGLKIIKFGRSMNNDAWRALYHRVLADPDFSPKSAYVRGEYNPVVAKGQDDISVG